MFLADRMIGRRLFRKTSGWRDRIGPESASKNEMSGGI
jgi:hypothetical protein